MGLSDLLESYLEGLRVKQFGFGYRQKAEAERLGNERAKQQITMAEEEAPIRRAKLEAETEDLKARKEGRLTFEERRLLQSENNAIKFRIAELQAAARTAMAPEEKARIEAQIRELDTRARLNEAKAKMPGGGMNVISPYAATTPEGAPVLLDRRTGQTIPGFMPAMAPTERKEAGGLEVMQQDAETLRRLTENPEVQNVIGPFAGRIAMFQRRFTGGLTPDQNSMIQLSNNLADQLLRARSGAQINEREYTRLRDLVPDPKTPWDTFRTTLERFQSELERTLAARFQRPRPGAARPAAPNVPSGATGEEDLIDRFLKKHGGGGVQ